MNKEEMDQIYNIKLAQFVNMLHEIHQSEYFDYEISIMFGEASLQIKLSKGYNHIYDHVAKQIPYYEITSITFELDIYIDLILDELVNKLNKKEDQNE